MTIEEELAEQNKKLKQTIILLRQIEKLRVEAVKVEACSPWAASELRHQAEEKEKECLLPDTGWSI